MSKNISFESKGTPKQKPSINSRIDYSIPISSDDDFSKGYFARDPDPLKTHSMKIIWGRRLTTLIAGLNIICLGFWIFQNISGDNPLAWTLGYGLSMILCCVFLFWGKEAARKLFVYPACLIGVPVVFALLLAPDAAPMFVVNSYQLALQIVSSALLYFVPAINTFFSASPKARARAFAREWEKNATQEKQ